MFSYVESVQGKTLLCTKEKFYEIIRRADVAELCEKFRNGDKNAKRMLPAFCFHATFLNNERKNENAIPSGLFLLDIDHVEDAESACRAIIEKNAENVMMVHITPSGQGVRVVAVCQKDLSIPQNQAILADMLGVDYDTAVKDLARLSFAVGEKDFRYIDENIFNDDYLWNFAETFCYPADIVEKYGENTEGDNYGSETADYEHNARNEKDNADGEDAVSADVADGSRDVGFGDNDLRDNDYIISTLIARLGGEPVEGERNTRLFAVTRYLRYIFDFNAEAIASKIPHYGLSDAEVLSICRNAVKTPRATRIPTILYRILQEEKRMRDEEELPDDCEDDIPPLPELMRIFVDTCPQQFKPAMICSLLPILGTVATNVRCVYLDKKTHSLSFMTVIIAPQASGKSFTRMPVDVLLEDIREKDVQARLQEQAYTELLKRSKNKREQPQDPKSIIRIIPVTISIAKLLKRLDNAGHQHLFSFSEEIDTLTKTNRSGAWAQKSDLYRLAFDNAEYGQDYMSENTYSAIVNVYYNLLLCGTPQAVKRFFRDVEDGLVTRVLFARLPDMFASELPIFGSLNATQLSYARKIVKTLEADSGTYKLKRTMKSLHLWLEKKREEAMESQSLMIDVFRRRSAVIGYRAGVLAYLLCDKRETATVVKFALWVASYCCRQQCDIFGQQLEKSSEESYAKGITKVMNLYSILPEKFTKQELVDLRVANFQSADVRMVIRRWKNNKLITEVQKNVYKKIKL